MAQIPTETGLRLRSVLDELNKGCGPELRRPSERDADAFDEIVQLAASSSRSYTGSPANGDVRIRTATDRQASPKQVHIHHGKPEFTLPEYRQRIAELRAPCVVPA
ncbi:hypothetical protein [Sciscionella sediminilitoris]|uniref:hypothetical protein n=1 Tax=Sciscionella sediminilitoris TaxID=1445613 RepID=UPI0004DED8F1|nr:hypothetical protein [Sciscionella sp. SE31]